MAKERFERTKPHVNTLRRFIDRLRERNPDPQTPDELSNPEERDANSSLQLDGAAEQPETEEALGRERDRRVEFLITKQDVTKSKSSAPDNNGESLSAAGRPPPTSPAEDGNTALHPSSLRQMQMVDYHTEDPGAREDDTGSSFDGTYRVNDVQHEHEIDASDSGEAGSPDENLAVDEAPSLESADSAKWIFQHNQTNLDMLHENLGEKDVRLYPLIAEEVEGQALSGPGTENESGELSTREVTGDSAQAASSGIPGLKSPEPETADGQSQMQLGQSLGIPQQNQNPSADTPVDDGRPAAESSVSRQEDLREAVVMGGQPSTAPSEAIQVQDPEASEFAAHDEELGSTLEPLEAWNETGGTDLSRESVQGMEVAGMEVVGDADRSSATESVREDHALNLKPTEHFPDATGETGEARNLGYLIPVLPYMEDGAAEEEVSTLVQMDNDSEELPPPETLDFQVEDLTDVNENDVDHMEL